MKYKFLTLLFCFAIITFGQDRIAVNATTLAGFPAVGYEKILGKHTSFQIDAIGSLFNQYNDAPLRFLMITPEFRYYFKSGATGFYVGGHIGGGIFELQKPQYQNTNYYQKGLHYRMGVSVGYLFKLSERLGLEIFAGGGNVQSFYKGYDLTTNTRYEDAKDYNKSGEWMPYRGGCSLVINLE